MTVIVNGRFLLHKITGVERYAHEILAELDKLVSPGDVVLAVPPDVRDVPHYRNIKIERVGKLKNRLWEHISLPRFVQKSHGIVLNLCNTAPLFKPGIVTIHDMKVKVHPEFFSRKFRMWYKILFRNETAKAEKIITVSEFSRQEIEKYYKVKDSRIEVIPNGWQHYERVNYDENALKKYGLEEGKYFFAMGSLEPNKNFKWIAETAKKYPGKIFAVAGSINNGVFSERVGFDCPSNMKLLGFVTDGEAKTLMRDSEAFLFPSIYEGFGIPPLEALSAGCRRIFVSDIPVMHEIFGESATYLDLNKYLIPEGSQIGYDYEKVLGRYSWKRSAESLLELLKDYCSI